VINIFPYFLLRHLLLLLLLFHSPSHLQVRADINKIRGLKECGWDFEKYNELVSDEKQKQIYEQNKKLLDEIKSDKDLSWPFEVQFQEIFTFFFQGSGARTLSFRSGEVS
jgi:hypothetical protein